MTDKIVDVAIRRAVELRKRLKRFKLVFVQCGASYRIIRDPLLAEVAGSIKSAVEFATLTTNRSELPNPIVLTGLEAFAEAGDSSGVTLGQLRQLVDDQLEAGAEVCLVSTMPRIAYHPVPGSSLIEDASVFALPPLDEEECERDLKEFPEGVLPSFGLAASPDTAELFSGSLRELGVELLATLDHALFEAKAGRDFPSLLEPREFEALRGAGFVKVEGSQIQLTIARRFNEFSKAVADVLAEVIKPQRDLGAVSEGLWLIERTIRRDLRELAISKFSNSWKRNLLHGDLSNKVVSRARSDTNLTASRVSDLRDPIEWLTLGELLEVVRSSKFAGLDRDELFWRRFEQDIVPIRNRLSHMRLVKKGDRETVGMWVSHFKHPRR